MDRREKAKELIERAKRRGIRLDFDSGLVLVKLSAPGDLGEQKKLIAELYRYLGEDRRLVEGGAIGDRATMYLHQQIWSELGQGTLIGSSGDGTLSISVDETGAAAEGNLRFAGT